MNFSYIINSEESYQYVVGKLHEDFIKHHYLRLNAKTGKLRSLPQNNFSHAWYEQLARELPEDDVLGWKCFCKLHFGVGILRAEDEDFREFYDLAIKRHLSYEEKLQAMKFTPVTSRMDRNQLSKYLEAIQSHFMKLGVYLEFPKEEK